MDCTSLTPTQRLLCILIQLVSTALIVNSVTVRMTVVLWAVILCSLVDGVPTSWRNIMTVRFSFTDLPLSYTLK